MPRIANIPASRQESCSHSSRRKAKKPRIRSPARENRAASRMSGGQSVTPIFPAMKAKLQSRQNTAIASGNVLKRAVEAEAVKVIPGAAEIGADIGKSPLPPSFRVFLAIWKLNH